MVMTLTTTAADWQIRHYVFEVLCASGAAPSIQAIARRFAATETEAQRSLRRLHEVHALVLMAGSDDILMANPLSALPTDYRVLINDVALYANCAWDSLGIPAMLGCDAKIEASHALSGEVMHYAVDDSELHDEAEGLVHFAHPFRQWYDNIVDT